MPICQVEEAGPFLQTVASGVVTDAELLAYYFPFHRLSPGPRWLELIDATEVTDLRMTSKGILAVRNRAATFPDLLLGGRVAVVTAGELIHGMLRMWEAQRNNLDYEFKVFRNADTARAWLLEYAP